VLREHAIASMTRQRRAWKVAFTGSSMASVQAAVNAGLGVSIVPLSSVALGMKVLGRGYPDPGRLDIGVVRAARTPRDVMDALQRVINQTLGVLLVSRAA
jgi:DNA-binding transcriptional LysR family regulator